MDADDLAIQFHRNVHAVHGGTLHPKDREYFENQALEAHVFTILDALREEFFAVSSELPQVLKNDQARIYLLYGAGRRLSTMLHSFRSIAHIAHVGREEPLAHEEQQVLSRDLNLVYLNIRGVLDNLASCLLHETEPDLQLDRNKIDLFSSTFRKRVRAYAQIAAVVSQRDDWNKEVKTRRDPAAHRIPLYLPPTMLTEREAQQYSEYSALQVKLTMEGKREEAEGAKAKSERLGKFYPYFLHHPNEPAFPLYPTIPTDIGNVIWISRAVASVLRSQILHEGER